jgi:hypothetical protein
MIFIAIGNSGQPMNPEKPRRAAAVASVATAAAALAPRRKSVSGAPIPIYTSGETSKKLKGQTKGQQLERAAPATPPVQSNQQQQNVRAKRVTDKALFAWKDSMKTSSRTSMMIVPVSMLPDEGGRPGITHFTTAGEDSTISVKVYWDLVDDKGPSIWASSDDWSGYVSLRAAYQWWHNPGAGTSDAVDRQFSSSLLSERFVNDDEDEDEGATDHATHPMSDDEMTADPLHSYDDKPPKDACPAQQEPQQQQQQQQQQQRGKQQRRAGKKQGDSNTYKKVDNPSSGVDANVPDFDGEQQGWNPPPDFPAARDKRGNIKVLAINFFLLFFTDDVLQRICNATNAYAHRREAELYASNPSRSADHEWRDTNPQELLVFLGICIGAGILGCKSAEHAMSSAWFGGVPAFIRKMSHSRFKMLFRNLCLFDPHSRSSANAADAASPAAPTDAVPPNTTTSDTDYNPYIKLEWFLDCIRATLLVLVNIGEYVSVDETMVPFKGMIAFRQYIKNKPVRYGFKFFVMAASKFPAVVKDFALYMGAARDQAASKKSAFQHVGSTARWVLQLLVSLGNTKGVKVYTDRFYTSVDLIAECAARGWSCVGTCMPNRVPKGIVALMASKPDETRGASETVQMSSCDGAQHKGMVFTRWWDNRMVWFMGWGPKPALESATVSRKSGAHKVDVSAPQIAVDYNEHMGGVDLFDKDWMPYMIPFRSHSQWGRWWLPKIFFWAVDLVCVHCYYFYCMHVFPVSTAQHKRPTGDAHQMPRFLRALSEQLLQCGADRQVHNKPINYEALVAAAEDTRCSAHQQHYSVSTNHANHAKQDTQGRGKCIYPGCNGRPKTFCKTCAENHFLCTEGNPSCYERWHHEVFEAETAAAAADNMLKLGDSIVVTSEYGTFDRGAAAAASKSYEQARGAHMSDEEAAAATQLLLLLLKQTGYMLLLLPLCLACNKVVLHLKANGRGASGKTNPNTNDCCHC